jgi:hypothetical protein
MAVAAAAAAAAAAEEGPQRSQRWARHRQHPFLLRPNAYVAYAVQCTVLNAMDHLVIVEAAVTSLHASQGCAILLPS